MDNLNDLEGILRNLGPVPSLLFQSSLLFLSSTEETEENALRKRHNDLQDSASGSIYYDLALSIVRDLEKDLVFSERFPFPRYSPRLETDTHDLVFINNEPIVGLCFPGHDEPDKIRVETGLGPYGQFDEKDLSKRLHVDHVTVDSLESFNEFLKMGLRGFRNANPFIPLKFRPEIGDLVYMVGYATHPKMQTHIVRDLGNVIPPAHRLAKVIEVREERGRRHYHLVTFTNGSLWFREKTQDEENKRTDEFVEELLLVKPKGWTEDDLKKPFMADEDAESYIGPVLFRYGGDPRLYTTHLRRASLLQDQFCALLSLGASSAELVETFVEDYGLSKGEFLRLAGIEQKQLGHYLIPRLEQITKTASKYHSQASKMIEETAKIMDLSPDQLISEQTSNSGIEDDELYARFFQRKVRGKTYDNRVGTGYVCEIFPRHTEEDDRTVNIFDDMVNPLSRVSIGLSTLESLALDAYLHPETLFELENICNFLSHQVDLIRSNNPDKPDINRISLEASEYLEDRLEEFRKRSEVDEKKSKGDHYQAIKTDLDNRVIGPMLSFGYNGTEIREHVAKTTNNNPLIQRALDECLEYRTRNIPNPFECSALAREMLNEITSRRANTSDEVGNVIAEFMRRPESLQDPHFPAAMNYLSVHALSAEQGAPFAPINELMHEETTGQPVEYIGNCEIARILERAIANSASSPLAIEQAARGVREASPIARAYVQEPADISNHLSLYISERDINIPLTTLILLDVIAEMNQDDPRNTAYLSLRPSLTTDSLTDNLLRIQVYPLESSNYFLVADLDKERYDREKDASIFTGNVQLASLVLPNMPDDQEKLIRHYRELGLAIKINGDHKFVETSRGFELIPEYELPGTGKLQMFWIAQSSSWRDRSYGVSRRQLRQFRHDEGYGPDFNHSFICANHPEFLGEERTYDLLARVGKRIEHDFGFHPEKLLAYIEGIRSAALPSPPLLLLEKE